VQNTIIINANLSLISKFRNEFDFGNIGLVLDNSDIHVRELKSSHRLHSLVCIGFSVKADKQLLPDTESSIMLIDHFISTN